MPSATPARDVSLKWPRCRRPGCGERHLPERDCPPRGVWLVARFCPTCIGGVYCRRHDGNPPTTPNRLRKDRTS